MEKDIYEYEGSKYAFVKDNDDNECDRCALRDKCNVSGGLICRDEIGIPNDDTINHRFEKVELDELTEDKAYEDYQERSKASNDRGEQLAWAFIVLLAAQLIGNHAYIEFYVAAACGLAYLLLSALQAVWQTFAIWVVKNMIKKDKLLVSDYPEWVGGWAWVFYYLKFALLTIGTVYAVAKFVSPMLQ